MPVQIQIDDGPPNAPWLSPNVLPGTLNGNSFTPQQGNLTRNQRYDFRVRVRNTGNQDTVPPLEPGPTGAFVPAIPLVSGGASPSGTSRAEEQGFFPGGRRQLALLDTNGNQLWDYTLPQSNFIYGYSPDGDIFIVIAATTVGVGQQNFDLIFVSTQASLPPGTNPVIYSDQITLSGSSLVSATAGWGFVPNRNNKQFFIAESGQTTINLRAINLSTASGSIGTSPTLQVSGGQFLFSPVGDLLAVIGQPNQQIDFYRTPNLANHTALRRGMFAVDTSISNLPVRLIQVKPSGFEAIELRFGSEPPRLMDSLTPSLPAVAVYLWVDKSSTVFDTQTARQYPNGTSGSMNPPSAFIDRIPAITTRDAVIDANFLAVTPPSGQHFCAIAEAFTTAGTIPANPRQRRGTSLSLVEDQIAQRNLVVS